MTRVRLFCVAAGCGAWLACAPTSGAPTPAADAERDDVVATDAGASDAGESSTADAGLPNDAGTAEPNDAGSAEPNDAGGDGDADAPPPPGAGLMHTAAQLSFMRAHREEPPWQAAHGALFSEAEAALLHAPQAVADFTVPFYYAHPEESAAAKRVLDEDAGAAYALALASQLTDDEDKRGAYAQKAIELLDAWAHTNTSVSGDDGVLVMIYAGVPLLYAADLVMGAPEWSAAGIEAFLAWQRAVFRPAAESIKERENNWGDWGTLGVVASSALELDLDGLVVEAERIERRIAENIDESGELPEENKRTNNGMWYTFFAMTSMTTSAHIIKNVSGIDLFSFTSDNGRSIHLALEREFFYAEHPEQWPYELPDGLAGELWRLLYPCDDEVQLPQPYGWPATLFEVMSDVYAEPTWAAWVEGARPLRGYRGFIFSTLMRQTAP